ncbi:MAG TPA: hypothetical protein VN086_02040, partial [Candidatus Paceibacterota bacterium]|nr:hypothetical protein [Candidatus Paceibacterota bacterium]
VTGGVTGGITGGITGGTTGGISVQQGGRMSGGGTGVTVQQGGRTSTCGGVAGVSVQQGGRISTCGGGVTTGGVGMMTGGATVQHGGRISIAFATSGFVMPVDTASAEPAAIVAATTSTPKRIGCAVRYEVFVVMISISDAVTLIMLVKFLPCCERSVQKRESEDEGDEECANALLTSLTGDTA